MSEKLMTWHDDGHIIKLWINKNELEITEIICPNQDIGACVDPVHGCLVQHFVNRFGMECNAGSCSAIDTMDICWTLIGDNRIIEECQLWFMPKTDEVFAAWLVSIFN